jgi:hypothetical protein
MSLSSISHLDYSHEPPEDFCLSLLKHCEGAGEMTAVKSMCCFSEYLGSDPRSHIWVTTIHDSFQGIWPHLWLSNVKFWKKKKISKPHFPPTEFSRPSMLSLFFYTLTQCSCLLQLSIDCYISEHIRIFLYNSPLTPVFFPCNNHVCQPLSTEIMLTAWVEYFHQHETDWHHLPIVPQESELELSHSCILVCLELFTPYPHLSLWIYNVPFEWGLNYIHFVILHETMHTEDTL